MKEITENVNLVAYCGLYCGACKAYLKERCLGCAKNEKATWCKIRSCCRNKKIVTCAECDEYTDPKECKKFNNIMSKIFGLLFRSDRRGCVMQIKQLGIAGHAKKMTELRKHTLPSSGAAK